MFAVGDEEYILFLFIRSNVEILLWRQKMTRIGKVIDLKKSVFGQPGVVKAWYVILRDEFDLRAAKMLQQKYNFVISKKSDRVYAKDDEQVVLYNDEINNLANRLYKPEGVLKQTKHIKGQPHIRP